MARASRQERRANRKAQLKARARRSCGECTACCDVFAVQLTPEYRKPACVACQHLSPAGGCGIYEERPQECRTFECLWRAGYFDEDVRPDTVNAIFVLDYFDDAEGWAVFRMRQITDAPAAEPAMQVVAQMIEKGHVVIVESRAEMAKRGHMPNDTIVPVKVYAKPDHPVHRMERIPSSRREGEVA